MTEVDVKMCRHFSKRTAGPTPCTKTALHNSSRLLGTKSESTVLVHFFREVMARLLRFQSIVARSHGAHSLLFRFQAASAGIFMKPLYSVLQPQLLRSMRCLSFSSPPAPSPSNASAAPASSSAASSAPAAATSSSSAGAGAGTAETDPEAIAIQSLLRRVHELYARAEYAEALPVAKEARRRAFHHFGSPSPVFASCVNNHALLLKALGSLDEAANLFDLALLNYEAGVGTRHASYLTCLGNMGAVHVARHKHEEARAVFERVLNARRELLPADHPEVAQAMYQVQHCQR